eukprot:1182464-Prorocentrum_minimum.AAC.2
MISVDAKGYDWTLRATGSGGAEAKGGTNRDMELVHHLVQGGNLQQLRVELALLLLQVLQCGQLRHKVLHHAHVGVQR